MKDSDAKIWSELDDSELTLIENPPRGKCLEDLEQWLDAHCEGDATLFKLGFA